MTHDTFANRLYTLLQSGLHSHPAFNILLDDYTKYHLVLFIEASIFALFFLLISFYFWRRFQRIQKTQTHNWIFEKKAFFGFGFVSTLVTLFLLLIVLANLSNVLNPQDGFAKVIPEIAVSQENPQKTALYQEVSSWIESGNAQIPALLKTKVQERLAWQRSKAIVSSILFVICILFTNYIWRKLIYLRTKASLWSPKEKLLLMIGIMIVPITLGFMLMAFANTQAAFAPIVLTILLS